MSDPSPKAAGDAAAKGNAGVAAAAKPPVYAHFFRLIGMPNFRFRLPSRNWSIFLTIVGSWTAAYMYDRREKKRIITKWSDRVAHLSQQTLQPNEMPRSIRIILGAPPADGLLTAREHFHEYVKPILVAGGMDWEAVEGRKEGDVRAMIAEKIREIRMRAGEIGELPERDESEEKKDIVREIRERVGTELEGGRAAIGGDLVIGRNVWKEYIRGLHEGWLGPLTQPILPIVEQSIENAESSSNQVPERPQASGTSADKTELEKGIVTSLNDAVDAIKDGEEVENSSSESAEEEKQKAAAAEAEKAKSDKAKRKQPSPFIPTADYADASLPPTISQALGPSVTVPIPHILGFLNTPIRMWRFLKQRELADRIGQQVASAVLASHEPYHQVESYDEHGSSTQKWEQEQVLKNEESEWHNSIRKKAETNREEGKESLWVDDMVLDPRIAGKMRKFVLPDSSSSSFEPDKPDMS